MQEIDINIATRKIDSMTMYVVTTSSIDIVKNLVPTIIVDYEYD